MKELFIPEDNGKSLEDLLSYKNYFAESVVVFSGQGGVYVWEDFDKECKLVCENTHEIWSLCHDDENVYFGDDAGFVANLNGQASFYSDDAVSALCFHKGELYFGDDSGLIYNISKAVYDVDKDNMIWDLCSFKNELYYACDNGVFNITSDKWVFEGQEMTELCDFRGQLLGSCLDICVHDVLTGERFDLTDQIIANTLVHEGHFYYGLYEKNDGWVLHNMGGYNVGSLPMSIGAIISVPRYLMEEFL